MASSSTRDITHEPVCVFLCCSGRLTAGRNVWHLETSPTVFHTADRWRFLCCLFILDSISQRRSRFVENLSFRPASCCRARIGMESLKEPRILWSVAWISSESTAGKQMCVLFVVVVNTGSEETAAFPAAHYLHHQAHGDAAAVELCLAKTSAKIQTGGACGIG